MSRFDLREFHKHLDVESFSGEALLHSGSTPSTPKIQGKVSQMRAITLWQPWSTLIARGLKKYETRSWKTRYRGQLLIHAADRKVDRQGLINFLQDMGNDSDLIIDLVDLFIDFMEFPRGCIVATANLVDCRRITTDWAAQQTKLELAVGGWEPGRYAWKLEKISKLHKPLVCKGRQGLWIPDAEITKAISQTEAKTPSLAVEERCDMHSFVCPVSVCPVISSKLEAREPI